MIDAFHPSFADRFSCLETAVTEPLVDWKISRGRVAALARRRATDDPELVEARRQLAVGRLEEHVRRAVEKAPPLTPEQRERVVALLGGARA